MAKFRQMEKFFLILSELVELKVLIYRNGFGKIFDFIGI